MIASLVLSALLVAAAVVPPLMSIAAVESADRGEDRSANTLFVIGSVLQLMLLAMAIAWVWS